MLSGGGVVLYDTTWGTNRYGMKLGCFTTVGRNGETIILAASLLMHETDDSFVWAFEQFRKAFRIPPSVFVTDGDPKMASAVSKIFPDSTKHMLCIYHLSLNFTEHIKPLFPDQADFKVATDLFWKIAKETDAHSKERFQQDFDKLYTYVEEVNCTNETKYNSALKFLRSLEDRREKWASRFTWSNLTMGVHSTQVPLAALLRDKQCSHSPPPRPPLHV